MFVFVYDEKQSGVLVSGIQCRPALYLSAHSWRRFSLTQNIQTCPLCFLQVLYLDAG